MLPRGGSEASRTCGGRRTCQAGGLSVRYRLPKGCSRLDSEPRRCSMWHRPSSCPRGHCRPRRCGPSSACCRLPPKQGQQVEGFVVKALPDQHEQLWNENGFLRELGKPKQILHVGILLDGLDGLLIAQPLNMLHYQSADNHAGGLIACTVVTVLQSRCIPALSCPREDCRQASLSGWTCSNPRETLEAQTARDCGIGSSVSCRFLLILTHKGNHFL